MEHDPVSETGARVSQLLKRFVMMRVMSRDRMVHNNQQPLDRTQGQNRPFMKDIPKTRTRSLEKYPDARLAIRSPQTTGNRLIRILLSAQ